MSQTSGYLECPNPDCRNVGPVSLDDPPPGESAFVQLPRAAHSVGEPDDLECRVERYRCSACQRIWNRLELPAAVSSGPSAEETNR